MKNALLFFLLLLFGFQLTAQEEEKPDLNFIVGGSFNFNFTKNSETFLNNNFSIESQETKSNSFSFAPFFGKEISDNWLVGVNLLYSSSTFKRENSDSKTKITDISIGVMSRYYITPLNKFSFFAQPSLAFQTATRKTEQDGNDFNKRTTTSITGGVAAGARYKLTKNLYTTLRFGNLTYANGSTKLEDLDEKLKFSSFDLNLRLSSIFFGVELSLN